MFLYTCLLIESSLSRLRSSIFPMSWNKWWAKHSKSSSLSWVHSSTLIKTAPGQAQTVTMSRILTTFGIPVPTMFGILTTFMIPTTFGIPTMFGIPMIPWLFTSISVFPLTDQQLVSLSAPHTTIASLTRILIACWLFVDGFFPFQHKFLRVPNSYKSFQDQSSLKH